MIGKDGCGFMALVYILLGIDWDTPHGGWRRRREPVSRTRTRRYNYQRDVVHMGDMEFIYVYSGICLLFFTF